MKKVWYILSNCFTIVQRLQNLKHALKYPLSTSLYKGSKFKSIDFELKKWTQIYFYITSFYSNNHIRQHPLQKNDASLFCNTFVYQRVLQQTLVLKDTTIRFSYQLWFDSRTDDSSSKISVYMMIDRITRTVSTIIKYVL